MSGISTSNQNNNVKVSDSSSPAKHMSSPTQLAFTPTSVLRKMTAEKEAETTSGVNAARNDSKTSVMGNFVFIKF